MPKEPPKQEHTDTPAGRRSIRFRDDPAYWQALGRFVETFARAEAMIFSITCFYAKVLERIGRIILSGSRTDICARYIRSIMEMEQNNFPDAVVKELDQVLTQLGHISNVRNDLIHYSSFETSDKGRIVSNISRAKSLGDIRETRASVADLETMTVDLMKISSHLTMLRTMPVASFDDRAKQMPILHDAWQYRPDPKRKVNPQAHKQPLHHEKRNRNR